jgi:hypothetical protein
LDRKARTEQPVIERHIAESDGARGGVADLLTETKILEEIARTGLRGRAHKFTPLFDRVRQYILTKP